MTCWICGGPANSKEHRFKKTDIRDHLGSLSSQRPLWRRETGKAPVRVQGPNSDSLKSEAPMCAQCNNQLTQPYDNAWLALSTHLARRWNENPSASRFWLTNVFGEDVERCARHVHLFFLKTFACRAIEVDAGVDVAPIAKHLRDGTTDGRLFLVFGRTPGLEQRERYALNTPVLICDDRTGVVQAAFTFYIVGRMSVELLYVPLGRKPPTPAAWHPDSGATMVRIRAFENVVEGSERLRRAKELAQRMGLSGAFES